MAKTKIEKLKLCTWCGNNYYEKDLIFTKGKDFVIGNPGICSARCYTQKFLDKNK